MTRFLSVLQCICPTGTQLNAATNLCEDIDECKDLGLDACANGECVNEIGSYRCECADGAVLDNTGRVCIGPLSLLKNHCER